MPPQPRTDGDDAGHRDGDGRPPAGRPLVLHLGHDELILRRRYETLSIVNDLLIALWFLVGSVMFLSPEWTRFGTWLFVLGSAELALRPLIRLSRRVHLQRVGAHESAADF